MSSLSVIIPVYNRAHLIGETLWSLLNQTLPADEIIVVDDGSTDASAEAARAAFAEWQSLGSKKRKTPELKILFQKNKGPAAARNAGFKASSGKFIHFFDSDDLAAHNKHDVQVLALEKSGADIAYAPLIRGKFLNGSFQASNQVQQQFGLPRGNLIRALLTNWAFLPHAGLFRRSIIEKVNGFPEDLLFGEDQLMFLWCLFAGALMVHTPQTIEFYREGDCGKITESKDWNNRNLQEWGRLLIKEREECLKRGIEPLCWLGYRRRLWESLQDLQKFKSQDEILINRLKSIAPAGLNATICKYHRQLERWYRGGQQRLKGSRAHSSIRMGPINLAQISLLKNLGYEYQAPIRLPWFFARID